MIEDSLLRRYGPFIAIFLLQGLLVAVGASGGNSDSVQVGAGGAGPDAGLPSGPATASPAEDRSSAGSTEPPAGGRSPASSGSAGGGGSEAVGGAAAAGPTGSASGSAQTAGSGQAVDELGRPLDGDRSKCTPDGRQEDISWHSPPCIPELVGPNPGSTWTGVSSEEIVMVIVYDEYDPAVQTALAANELAMSPEQAAEAHDVLEEFYERHYNLYGRRLRIETYYSSATDAIELRAEAKEIAETFKPFAALSYTQTLMAEPMADQLTREGILAIGAGLRSDSWYSQHAPFAYDGFAQGSRLVQATADFYCKRMHGKTANLAGDPAMHIQTRKLGIVAFESPDSLEVANLLKTLVSGGMCGSSADGTTIYVVDVDQAADQAPALVQRMKDDGMTTISGGYVFGAEMDNQQYFPEHLLSEFADNDFVGRVFAALFSPNQMQNSVGVGLYVRASPNEEHEFYNVYTSVRPDYDPPLLAEAPWDSSFFFVRAAQFAGPNLTPDTFLRGLRSIPQINGWENPAPWSGWSCCDPYRFEVLGSFGGDVGFSAKADVRQIYWSNTERSEGDGAPGSWVGVDDSRRYEIGSFTLGEPRQP